MLSRRGRIAWRLIILLGLISIGVLSYLSWHTATSVAELKPPEVGVPSIADGTFLGILIDDRTHDKFVQNAWLRLSMNSGYQSAIPARRYQIGEITLRDGQHPETGEAAVIVLLTPKPQEVPLPPFEPIAVRRWQPSDTKYQSQQKIADTQRIRPPHPDDLQRLEENWSGKPGAAVESLITSLYRLLLCTAVGIGFIVLAGAYRSFQSMSTKWDAGLVEQQKSRAALDKLRTIRRERDAQERLDG